MKPLPHVYEVHLTGRGAHATVTSPLRPTIIGGAPPEFDGDADVWSPEHLLLSSVGMCLFTTFRAVAKRASFAEYSYRDRLEARLEKSSAGPRFAGFKHHVTLEVENEAARATAESLLRKASNHCIIAATLNVPVELEVTVALAPASDRAAS